MDQLSLLDPTHALRPVLRMYTLLYSVWLKCQVRERVTVMSLDIGTGFQFFRRQFTEIQEHLESRALRPAEGPAERGKVHSGLEKATIGINFSAMELCIDPCFEAATAPNQTLEPVRNEDERVCGRNYQPGRSRIRVG